MKIGVVLEGGAMRGMFTAGVLDVFLENNIEADVLIGVSAGALFGINYLSKQKGRVIRYSKKYCHDLRYISILSFLLTGNIVNKNFAYYKIAKKLDVFDDDTFKNSKCEFYATATNMETGKPDYLKISSCFEQIEELRATSSIPLLSKPVVINNNKYLDGAISDSIPVIKLKEMGCDKIIVILTRPDGYIKKELSPRIIKNINKKFKNYPNFIKSMINRANVYNETLKKIKDMEENDEIYVIRPPKSLDIKVIERSKKKLQSVYDLGVNEAKNSLNSLKEYLNK